MLMFCCVFVPETIGNIWIMFAYCGVVVFEFRISADAGKIKGKGVDGFWYWLISIFYIVHINWTSLKNWESTSEFVSKYFFTKFDSGYYRVTRTQTFAISFQQNLIMRNLIISH